jgi:chaperonin GroES
MKKKKTAPKKAKKAVTKASKKAEPSVAKSVPQIAKNAFKVTPLADRVVVRPLADEASLRPSGIYIPETADKERPQEGTVVAVGPGAYDDGALVPMRVKVGDTVMFSKYGYDEVKIDGVEYFVVKEENILAVIK